MLPYQQRKALDNVHQIFFVFCNFRCCVDNVDNDDNSHGNDDSNDDHTGRRMKGDTNYIEAKLFTP